MNIQDQRLKNARTVANHVCKECYGKLVEKRIDGHETVTCAADATHEGFIHEAGAAHIQELLKLTTHEVLQNYPQFKPDPVRETRQESTDLLFL